MDFTPAEPWDVSITVSIAREKIVTEAVQKALPVSLVCSLLISVVCSLLLSKGVTMILGVGKYQDCAAFLSECKEMVEQLSAMIHDILEISGLNMAMHREETVETDLTELLEEICEPYQLIAAAHHISFSLKMPQAFPVRIPVGEFGKAVSNILANAVAYTEAGKSVSAVLPAWLLTKP